MELATRGGARVLNRDDIGYLAPGMAADLAIFDLGDIAFAGAQSDPAAALVFCDTAAAAYTIVNGRIVVRNKRLATVDLPLLIERHNRLSSNLLSTD